MSSGTAAVLFDIDDTLLDANSLHIHPWCRAFAEVGVGVESWRIHRSIGMDGSELVKSLAAEAGENAQKRASELHSRYYKDTAPLLRVLPGARELLSASRSSGSAGGARHLGTQGRPVDTSRIYSTARTSSRRLRRPKMSRPPNPTPPSSRSLSDERACRRRAPCSSAIQCGTRKPVCAPECPSSGSSAVESRGRSWKAREPVSSSTTPLIS